MIAGPNFKRAENNALEVGSWRLEVDAPCFTFLLGAFSPLRLDSVFPENTVARHERVAFFHRLRHQQPVERIAVMEWQALDHGGLLPCDGQDPVALFDLGLRVD